MRSAVEVAVDTYILASQERDPAVRAQLLEACFAEDGRMVTRNRELHGRAALADMLARFHANPQLQGIRVISKIDAQGTTFRFRAVADFRDGPSVEAFDAGEIDESGRISLILTFAGPLGDAED
jgi:hypothetical protein